MKKIIIPIVFLLLCSCIVSAEIIISQQPEELYNMGDTINLPLKINTLTNIQKFFTMNLICNGVETEIYKEYLSLNTGEEVERNPFIPLISGIVDRPGTCVIKMILGEENKLTSEFEISDFISVELKTEKEEFAPGETMIVEGDAKRKNGKNANGIVELTIINQNTTIAEATDTVKNGYFHFELVLSSEIKAGKAFMKVNVYETDLEGKQTNKGSASKNIVIRQIPTSLELIVDNPEVEPGTNLEIRTILHDQTGESIDSNSVITVKNGKGKIIEQTDYSTNDVFSLPIVYNEKPDNWTVFAISNDLESEVDFEIMQKEDIDIGLINKTLVITNMGNVPYDKLVLVKIGEESLSINVSLDVDEVQKYVLTAPDGEYEIEVSADGNSKFLEVATLTGNAIDVEKISKGVASLMKYSIVWIFITLILGFTAFLIFKKGHKRMFFGRASKKNTNQKKPVEKEVALRKGSIVKTRNKAELSLSIKGSKQNASIVCLKIKNLKEIQSRKSNAEETLQSIVIAAENNKAFVYENQDCLFFILSPLKTRTFKNEKVAIMIAQQAQAILMKYNKLAKQKIDFGISINYGTIIAKEEKNVLRFMSMGTLITTAKKIASISKNDLLLSENIKGKLGANIKVAKHQENKLIFYSIKEIKDRENNKKFIQNFIKRIEDQQ